MDRLPPILVKDLDSDQLIVQHEMIVRGPIYLLLSATEAEFSRFQWQRSDGALIGLFPSMLRTPEVARGYFHIIQAVAAIPGISFSAREAAVLIIAARYQASFALYSHIEMAKASGLRKDQVAVLSAGRKPNDLEHDQSIAVDMTIELLDDRKLSQETWERALSTFGEPGVVALVQFVGLYIFVDLHFSVFQVPLPPGEHLEST